MITTLVGVTISITFPTLDVSENRGNMRLIRLSLIGMILALPLLTRTATAKEWRGIVPLKSTRADVERLLGKPGKHGRYQFDEERAYIDYAGAGRCKPINGCLCFVSEDTVISIRVELEVEMSFSELKIDHTRFKKYISPQNPALASYSNEEAGIIYTVDDGDVMAIEYLPTVKDCDEIKKTLKRPRKKSFRKRSRTKSMGSRYA